VGHLFVAGRPSEGEFEAGIGILDLSRLLPHRPRNPVHGAEFVEDGAPDPELGVGFELDLLRCVEFLDGIDEAYDPGIDEVVQVDVGREPDGDTTGYVLDQG